MRHTRFIVFCVALAIGFAACLGAFRPAEAFMVAFDIAAVIFIASSVPLWLDHGAHRQAEDDDGGRLFLPLVALVAVAAVLLAVGLMIGTRASLTAADAGMVAATLVLAWIFANLILAFHYSRMSAGIEFPGGEPPTFSDYVYFSFVIGMTCQTADVTMTTARLRRVGMLHGISAFFFNLGVLALSVNVLSGIL
ncbi:DUF1345 domain-containing protein [Cereibacter sp. SYSU M97828]|nr:DUF1345 domain-containing protein [Cereibacter flavus]